MPCSGAKPNRRIASDDLSKNIRRKISTDNRGWDRRTELKGRQPASNLNPLSDEERIWLWFLGF